MSDPSDIRKSTVSSSTPKKTVSLNYNSRSIIIVIAVLVLIGLSFWAGDAYGARHNNTNGSSISRHGGFGGVRGGGFGTVSAISTSSITVQNNRTGSTKTFSITSSTKITNDGQPATTSSIATGDNVIVMPSSSNSSDAASVIVNPSFEGGPVSAPGSSTGSQSGSVTTQ